MKHTKICTVCKEEKNLSEYHKFTKNNVNIGQSSCKECRKKDKANIRKHKATHKKR